MPRFFFHFQHSALLEDDEGEEFPTAEAAKAHARRVAWELAKNAGAGANLGKLVILSDDENRELLRVPLHGATEPR